MSTPDRIEELLARHVDRMTRQPCPPRLAGALEEAVLAGGGRVRPRLVLAVAGALAPPDSGEARRAESLAGAAAVAVELMHCASLVHDDLPCFDDADYRRGRPTVHTVYGEATAVLAGDALIVAAFQTLTAAALREPAAVRMLALLGDAAGAPRGIAAGQAWEEESSVDLVAYHDAKTASMFEASVMLGALAAGADPAPWRAVGRLIGEAYQLADDLADHVASPEALGKPVRQDRRNDRPNAAAHLGVSGAMLRLRRTLEAACDAVPECPGRAELQGLLQHVGLRLLGALEPAARQPTEAAA